MAPNRFHAVLFKSVNQTMWAGRILKEHGVPYKLIPVPRHISSDCGVCLRINEEKDAEVEKILKDVEGFTRIVTI